MKALPINRGAAVASLKGSSRGRSAIRSADTLRGEFVPAQGLGRMTEVDVYVV
jgi:hypothetical protein